MILKSQIEKRIRKVEARKKFLTKTMRNRTNYIEANKQIAPRSSPDRMRSKEQRMLDREQRRLNALQKRRKLIQAKKDRTLNELNKRAIKQQE